jgi:hypothetical protein
MIRKIVLLLALAGSAIGWTPIAAQREVTVEGDYVHGPAHAVYPLQVGDFHRSEIYQYDELGEDVSASYNLATPEGRLLITVYIYPATPAVAAVRASRCDEEFAAVNSVISTQHDNVAPIEEGAALPIRGVDPSLTHRSAYRFGSPFEDRVQEIRSEAHLYCYVGGDWLVKYRVTAPVAVETRRAVEAFIRNGPWPGRSST